MSVLSDDAPCANCGDVVSGESQALDCDLCGKWLHLTCIGISQQAYEIYSQFEGQLPWFCTNCLASLKSLHSSLDQLTLENHALKLELTQLRSLDSLVANLSHEVSRLSRDLAFITKPDLASVSMNPACSPLKCQIPKPITPHPNRFECLVDRNPDMPVNHGNGNENPNSNPSPTPQTSTSSLLDRNPDVPVDHGNGNPNSNPSPTPQISTSKPRKATKKPQPQTASNRNPPIPKFYIRAVPRHTSIQEVKRKLQSLSVPHDHLSEPYLTTPDSKMKYLEIFLSVDDANKLDKGLKGDATLGWFVSIFAPKRPHPVPLMSLKLPPVPSDHKDKCPIPLMSLKLPPLPTQQKQQLQPQATQDFLGRGKSFLIVR